MTAAPRNKEINLWREFKNVAPEPRQNDIARPRLLEHMEAGLNCRLTIVSAPSGWGKSTLAAQWSRSAPVRTAWLQLDAADNDPARFLEGLLGAFQKIYPSIGKNFMADMRSPKKPPLEELLRNLLQDVQAHLNHFALILDDYHVIDAPPVHSMITFLVGLSPPQMHLYLLTRSDPPFGLSELRGHDQLKEIRTPYLSFTMDEAGQLLNDTLQLEVPFGEVTAMVDQTKAHPGLLKLAGLALRRGVNRPAFLQDLEKSDNEVAPFLLRQLLSTLSQEQRQWLAEAAAIGNFPADLLEDVYPQEVLQQVKDLSNEGLGCWSAGKETRWYCAYPYLQYLMAEHPEVFGAPRQEIIRTAAGWFAGHGYLQRGFLLSVSSGDFDSAAGIVEEHAQRLLQEGQLVTVEAWLEKLPETLAAERPMLSVCRAWVGLIRQNPPMAAAALQAAKEAAQSAAVDSAVQAHIQAIEDYLTDHSGAPEKNAPEDGEGF